MTIFQVEAEIPMGAAEYWEVRETAEFLEHQCIQLNLKSVEELERWREGDKEYVKVKTIPNVNLPWVVRKMMGGKTLQFVDTHCKNTMVPPYSASFVTTPPVMEDKIHISGQTTIVEVDENNSKQVLEGEVKCTATGGGLVAKIITDNLKKSYKEIPGMVQKFKDLMEEKRKEMEAERAQKEAEEQAAQAKAQEEALQAAAVRESMAKESSDLTATDHDKEIVIPDDAGGLGDLAGEYDSIVSRPSQSAATSANASPAISVTQVQPSVDQGGDPNQSLLAGDDGSDTDSEIFFSCPEESPFLSVRAPSMFRALSPSKPFLHSRRRGSTLFSFKEDPETGSRQVSYFDPAGSDDDDDAFVDAEEGDTGVYYTAPSGDLGESPKEIELRPRAVSRLRQDGRKRRSVTISLKPGTSSPLRNTVTARQSTAYQKMDEPSAPPPQPKRPWWKCCGGKQDTRERKNCVSVSTM